MGFEFRAEPQAIGTWLTVMCWDFQKGPVVTGANHFWQRKPTVAVSVNFLSQNRSKGLCRPETFRGIGTAQKSLIYCKLVATAAEGKHTCQTLACVCALKWHLQLMARQMTESWNQLRKHLEAS